MNKKLYPSDKQDKFMLRLPDGMRERLKELAKANARSLNAEIVKRLEDSLETQPSNNEKPNDTHDNRLNKDNKADGFTKKQKEEMIKIFGELYRIKNPDNRT